MKYQLTRCSSTTLNNVPITDGQIIYVKDIGEQYLDVDSKRIKITDTQLQQDIKTIIEKLDTKIDKATEINKVYGTDNEGNQTTFNKDDLSKVDDVQVDGTSVLNNKIANIDIQSVKDDYNNKIDTLTSTVNTNKEDANNSINTLTQTVTNNKTNTD